MTGPAPHRLSERAKKDVEKYLLPDEKWKVATRRHPAVLFEPTVKALPVFLLGGVLLVAAPANRTANLFGLLLVVASLAYYGMHVAEWWMRHFIVSTRRVLLTSGVIVRTVTLLPLRRITDLTWKETLFGQLLGYGTFRFESAGQQQALSEITFLPGADGLYRRVSALLFGSDWGSGGGGGGGDDEGNPESPSDRQAPGRERRDTEPSSGGRTPGRERRDTEPIQGLPPHWP